jgi:glycosyltransferase involved in cell wall biosynthesis
MLAATRIIVNTPFAEGAYRRKYPEIAQKFVTLTNGFDDDDFRGSEAASLPPAVANRKAAGGTLVSHIGNFSRHGCRRPLPDAFLAALVQARKADPHLRDRLSVIFAGRLCDAAAPEITAMGLDDLVSLPGLLEHGAAVSLMLRSDYLLLYEDNAQGETYVRGKVYEYLRAGRPIIGVLPAGATRDLVERFPCARLFYPDDLDGLAGALLDLKASRPCVNEGVEDYDYRNLTAQLASVLGRIDGR